MTTGSLDPDQVAYFETEGWRAYYDRNWLRAFWLLVQLNRTQFGMGWLTALSAALNSVRAARAFAPLDNDVATATAQLTRFYAKARRSFGIQADANTLAQLEMRYWIVHRELAIQRQQDRTAGDIGPMIEALVELHAALANAPAAAMRPSAELRALAAKTVDRITGGYSTDVAADWRQTEHTLQQAYRAVADARRSTQ